MKFCGTALEAFPQLIINLLVMLDYQEYTEWKQIASAVTSFLTLVFGVAGYVSYDRHGGKVGLKMKLIAIGATIQDDIFRVMFLAFSYFNYKYFSYIFIGFYGLVMTAVSLCHKMTLKGSMACAMASFVNSAYR